MKETRQSKQPRMASELRVKKDMNELSSQRFTCPHATVKLVEPCQKDEEESTNHQRGGQVIMSFSGGYYAGGTFVISVSLPETYPFRPPRVHCLTRVWHPNVELSTGRVSHPLLESDWKPVLSINAVVLGIQLLFLEPNPEYPANNAAASTFIEDRERFAAQVRKTLRGGVFFGFEFPPQLIRRYKRTRDSPVVVDDNSMDLRDDVEGLTIGESPDQRWMKRCCRKEFSSSWNDAAESVDHLHQPLRYSSSPPPVSLFTSSRG